MLPFPEERTVRSARLATFDRVRAGSRPTKPLDPNVTAGLVDPARVVFLDVETTGLSWYYDHITIVGWMRAGRYDYHIAGQRSSRLTDALNHATTLVTFNGTLFDLRFLRKAFSDLKVPPLHIDLRYFARRVGLRGGQKAIERLVGAASRTNLEDVDGAEAVLLWHRYLRGDRLSLRKLIEYNRYDVIGMCKILDVVIDRLNTHPDLWLIPYKFAEGVGRDAHFPAIIGELPIAPNIRPNHNTFESTFARTPAKDRTVVGIDLTGSESKRSGFSILRGSQAETDMVASDDEIITRTLAASPDIVSIDSPLSIPFGRTCVEDSDPGRDRFGIMRRCERELKRRGINVYPCLLPSMQSLTRRGMSLASRFRAAGVPVIESYPGAAQDIMGIPRKGAGIEFLKQGLVDFGIQGSFVDQEVSHDELDAITSAIVGLFFLSGRYEALRGPSEDALIIPDLIRGEQSGMVIGISGRICAGKTTTARILEQRGFAYTRFSLVIDDEITAQGQVLNRATRQRVGAEINRTRGQRWLCEKVLERICDEKLIVVDGLRFPEDRAFFIERFGPQFLHLHIEAADHLRSKRYVESERDNPPFNVADRQDVESKIDELGAHAATLLQNDTTIDELRDKLLKRVKEFADKQGCQCLSQLS